MKKCPYCSEDIQDEAKKCRFCWEFLENTEQNEEVIINLDTVVSNEKSKMDYALGILFVTSLITIWLLSSIIQWILWVNWVIESTITLVWNAMSFMYIISLFILTPLGIYLLVRNNTIEYNPENLKLEELKYGWFWLRLIAQIIDRMLSILIIPLFINLYFHFKYWQTIWYKVVWLRIYTIENNNLKFPSWSQLFFYPIAKILNYLTLYIWFLMIAFTKRKQWLHNFITDTVVVEIRK